MRPPDWQTEDGSIRLFCGDCLDILPELEAGSVDAVVTDPPYGCNAFDGSRTHDKYGMDRKHNWDVPVSDSLIVYISRVCSKSIIWGGNYYADVLPRSKGWLVWIKPDAVKSMASCELAWTSLDINAKHITRTIAATNSERVGFPAQKPIVVMEWSLGFVSGVTVLDPFMGSGTTGVACVRLGRRFIGIEKERKYFDIAVKRITDELGKLRLFEPPPKIVQRNLLEDTK